MSLIFLSHSSADELEAVALKQWLLDNGWDDVFLDLDPERGLRAGERWQEALRRAADRCEAVVFIISPAWAISKWCLTEFLLAKSLNKLIFGVVVKETAITELPTELTAEFQLTYLIGKGSVEAIRFVHHEQPADVSFLANGLGRLRLGLQTAGLNASFFPWPPQDEKSRAPYRGLEPLDAKDAAVFFGRDAEILQGLDKLRGMRASGDEGLLVILGPSGAGKSSFLRAGLLPRLTRNARHFHALEIIRPERSPLFGERGLAHAISRANHRLRLAPINVGEVKTALSDGPGRLEPLLRSIQNAARHQLLGLPEDAPPPTLILPVDQAEELFSTDATEEARRFLEMIGSVLRASLPDGEGPELSLIIAFTIRSDRYEPLQTASELMGLKTVVFDALKPMPLAQFKEVITGPAMRATLSGKRLEVKPDLVQQLLADSDRGGDTLPLLSLTLSRLYRDYSSDGDLGLDEYQGMGGMSNVIRTEVDSILAYDPEIRKAQLETLHAAFIPWLATINAENDHPMRRVAHKSDLPAASHALIQALIEKRLLLSDMRNGKQIVEVTHESLLRQWDTLAKWLEKEREDLKDADRLEQAASAWNKSDKKADWLMEGERLMIAETLAAKPGYHRRLEPAAEFLLCSRQRETQRKETEERQRQAELVAAQEKQAAAEEQQRIAAQLAKAERRKAEVELAAARDREAAAEVLATEQLQATERAQADSARLKKRAKQLLATVFGALILAGATGYGFFHAEAQRKNAERAQIQANGLRLAAESQAMMDGTRVGGGEREVLQLLAAWRTAPSNEVESGLLTAFLKNRNTRKIIATGVPVYGVAFSPDGTRIVSGSGGHTLRLWDAKTGASIGSPLQGHEDQVLSVAFSPDGTRIVSGSWDHTLRLWDVKTGAPIGSPLQGHEDQVLSVAFSPDGTRIVSGSGDKTLRLWDVKTGAPIGSPLQGHEDRVNSVAFSPDGTRIVSGSWDKTLQLWNAKTGEPIGSPLQGHEDWVLSAAFSPDGTRIVSGSLDKTLRLWNVKTGAPIGSPLQGHEDQVLSVAFSPDGTRIVSGSWDKTLRLWNAKTGEPIGSPLQGHEGWVLSAAFSPDGTRIVSGSWDKTLRLWDVKTGAPMGSPLQGHEDQVLSAAFSPDGTRIVSGSWDHTLRLWDAKTGAPIGSPLQGHEDQVLSVAFSPDGTRIVSGSWDHTLRLWDAKTGEPIGSPLQGHEGWVLSAAFSPDGTRIVSGSWDHTLRLWDAKTGEPIGSPLQGHVGGVLSVAFSPDGTRIVSGSGDHTLRLWDAKTGASIGSPLQGHEGGVLSVAFSPDGTRIVSGSGDETLRLWNAKTGEPIGSPLQGHVGGVLSVAFSPDGTRIVSGSWDKTLRLWNAKTGAPIGSPLQGHEGWVSSVAFSPDGTRIVSGSWDKTLRLWPGPKVWLELLCAKLTRNLSHAEWHEWVSPTIPSYTKQCPGLPISPDEPAAKEK